MSDITPTSNLQTSTFNLQRLTSNSQLPFLWLGGALAVGLLYLAVSAWAFGYTGFPLDDAWIHQTYARNLADSGQLAFTPGQPSAGSTAPLWTFWLSLGYLLKLPYQIWTFGLGLLFLGLTGWTAARLAALLFPQTPRISLWAGLFCLAEWHLVWVAVSGMETILFVWLSLFLVERYTLLRMANESLSESANLRMANRSLKLIRHSLFAVGLLGGLLILTRPEGLLLVGLIGLDMLYDIWRRRPIRPWIQPLLRRWLLLAAGLAGLIIPYVAFHLWATGRPFPNTFYAKQAEYAIILQHFSLGYRLFGGWGPSVESVQGVFRVIFIGPQILLLPGLVWAAWLTVQQRRSELWFIWLWWIGFLLLYGLRLPVTYQHGRYQIPAIPWVILLGLWGTIWLINAASRRHWVGRVGGRAWLAALVVLLIAFLFIGAAAYGRDVRFIESEMVATARWLAANTHPQALIAAHDIGALGYFAPRPLIDLAGLVTPEVIPIIRDESALLNFILAHQAAYLVTFPSWYPEMTQNPALIRRYHTESPWAIQAGGDNMAVYQISR
jgi:hypothetical protein